MPTRKGPKPPQFNPPVPAGGFSPVTSEAEYVAYWQWTDNNIWPYRIRDLHSLNWKRKN